MGPFIKKKYRRTLLLAVALPVILLVMGLPILRVFGLGVPNVTFPQRDLFTVISRINGDIGAPLNHGPVNMHNGYMALVFAKSEVHGGFAFFDISDPYNPVLVSQKFDKDTKEFGESHGYGASISSSGSHVVIRTHHGIDIWDWTDIHNPAKLSHLELPGAGDGYNYAPFWVFWQAPYIYVGSGLKGLYIVDASNPRKPVMVNRGKKPNPIPSAQMGNYKVGSVFAVGNLLFATKNNGKKGGYTSFDISDPENPVILEIATTNMPGVYSSLVNGNMLYVAGNNDELIGMDISDPSKFDVTDTVNFADKGGYLSFQDGFVHVGASSKYYKVDVSNSNNFQIVDSASSKIDGRDEDFATVLGNLVVVGDDHGNGSFIIPHQSAPDRTGPAVNMVVPKNNATKQAVTSRVGLTFTDLVDLSTVDKNSFIVRPVGGQALNGTYSGQNGIVNFSPDSPLQANKTYEVIVPAGGIKDVSGNATETRFSASFSTGNQIVEDLSCEIAATDPTEVNQQVNFTATVTNGSGNETYSWDFGDGTDPTTPGPIPNASHVYDAAGNYNVFLEVVDGSNNGSCVTTHTVFTPTLEEVATASSSIILNRTGDKIWNVNPDNNKVSAIGAAGGFGKLSETAVGKHPTTLAQAPDGTIWVVNQDDATISIINGNNGNNKGSINLPYASRPFGIAFSPDGSAAYVTLEATGRLLRIDPGSQTITGDIAVGPTPHGLAVSSDSSHIFITRFISPEGHGEVVEVNANNLSVTRTIQLRLDPGPDAEDSGRGVPNALGSPGISPDGSRLWVPSKKDNTVRGLQLDGKSHTFESTVRAMVAQIDLTTNSEHFAGRIDLDNRDRALAVGFSPLGNYVFVVMQGSNAVEIVDSETGDVVGTLQDAGDAPQGIAFNSNGTKAFVHSFLSRSVSVYDLTDLLDNAPQNTPKLKEVDVVSGEKLSSQVLKGKKIFYNADDLRMSRDGYLSCASCHIGDGGQDGRVWDRLAVGEGFRNNVSLLGRAGMGQGRVHWSANFDEIQDFEHDMRAQFSGTGFMSDVQFNTGSRNQPLGDSKAGVSSELDALAAYVASLDEVRPSPFRKSNGTLTADGQAGKTLFNQLGCANCHGGREFSDSPSGLLHDVGTIKATSGQRLGQTLLGIDTPTLRGIWETAPYLHDGSAKTLLDVLTTQNSNDIHGATSTLNSNERNQLAAYLQQIDNLESNAPAPQASISLTAPADGSVFGVGGPVTIAASTNNVLGSIANVEFYVDNALVYTDTQAPYSYVWNAPTAGDYLVTARAKLSSGLRTTVNAVRIEVSDAPLVCAEAAADAYVRSNYPSSNYGTGSDIRVKDASSDFHSYLKFNVQGVTGTVQRATLRLSVNDAGADGGTAYVVGDSGWSETGITWNNAPAMGQALGSAGAVSAGGWAEIDVSSAVAGNGLVSLGIKSGSSDIVKYSSREGSNAPQLCLEFQGGPLPAPAAEFTADKVDVATGETVRFTDMSTGAPFMAWAWEFGDGGTATGQNPSHTYNAPGTYAVTLTVTNSTDSDTETKNGYITVTEAPASVCVEAAADAYVRSNYANSNYGTGTDIRVKDAASDFYSYLKFNVQGVTGTVQRATLRLSVNDASADGGTAYVVGDSGWSETGITWNNAPAMGQALGSAGAVSAGGWAEIDVSSVVAGNGLVSLGIKSGSSDIVKYSSREGSNAPQLCLEYQDGPLPAPAAEFAANKVNVATGEVVHFTDMSTGAPFIAWAWEFGDGGMATGQNPSHAYNAPGTYTVSLTVTNSTDSDTETKTGYITVTDAPAGGSVVYVSSSSSGETAGVRFKDEDILAYDIASTTWTLYFDGSEVGLGGSGVDIDAFYMLDDGSILLSLVAAATLPDVGKVDDSDIVQFVPSALGLDTAGTYALYFDGSDVDLSSGGEDIDALAVLDNGDLLISVSGSFSDGSLSVRDEDVLRFEHISYGENTSGSWSLYFDGSDVGLAESSNEDVWGLWTESSGGAVYLSSKANFSVPGTAGDGADVISCLSPIVGSDTSCSFALYWDGSANGFAGEVVDGLHMQIVDPGGT